MKRYPLRVVSRRTNPSLQRSRYVADVGHYCLNGGVLAESEEQARREVINMLTAKGRRVESIRLMTPDEIQPREGEGEG